MVAPCPVCDTDLLTAVTLLGSPAQHSLSDSHSVCKYVHAAHSCLCSRTVHYTITYHKKGCILFSFDNQTVHLLDAYVGISPQLTNFM